MLSSEQSAQAKLFTAIQWRLWLFQLILWALFIPAYTSWSLAVFALLLLAKLWQLNQGGAPWSLTKNNVLAGAMLIALLLSAIQLGVIHLMLHLLLLAAILRLLGLTSSKPQDVNQLLWVHYFLVGCAFILHQDLWLAVLIFAVFLLNLQCQFLHYCRQIPTFNWRRISRIGALIMLCTTLLFTLFPRLAPLWQLPGAKLTKTGLSDTLAPGTVGKLLQSNDLAFRVNFDGSRPPAANRYFRAKIYDVFDGVSWYAQLPQPNRQARASITPTYRYTVIVEPHQQLNLFALGEPAIYSNNVVVTPTALIVAKQPVSQRMSYQISSAVGAIANQDVTERFLQLPFGNPKSRQLAEQLKQGSRSATELTGRISQYFQQQQFQYSLTPGEISGAQIDNFLFERKLGFCSHYAGSAVFLLRAAGIPARLVGGYLGGEWQDDGTYLQVLQKDAHAWVEYYQAGRWWSYDPTALIEPALLGETDTAETSSDFTGLEGSWFRQSVDNWLLQPLRNMDYYWAVWVLSFDPVQQRSLFAQLHSWRQNLHLQWQSVLWLGLVPLLILGRWWWRRPRLTPVVRLFKPLQQVTAKQPAQSYQEYLLQIAQSHPELASTINIVLDGYLRWQFGGEPTGLLQARRAIEQLAEALKRLKS